MPQQPQQPQQPQHNPIKFLLNREDTSAAVSAPAFSITKVLATAAIILGPITTALVSWLGNAHLSDGQYVVLAVTVVAFIAILGAADVLARAHVTASKPEQVHPFDQAEPGHFKNQDVQVFGEVGSDQYLVVSNNHMEVVPRSKVVRG